jgi:two-component system sensor histidine kinase BaeS
MALAVLIGSISARRITVPLARVSQATQLIARGQHGVRIGEKTRVKELDGIASAVNDLSRALGEQEALRRRLTADMAHELRTPLATLQSHLEALIDGVWQPDQSRLAGLHEEILRINRLVSDLEKLAHFEGDAGSLNRIPTDVTALVAGIVRNHEPQFEEKGIALAFSGPNDGRPDERTPGEATPHKAPPNEPLSLAVDPDKLSQAVINLLSNALKYTPSGGTVSVCVCATPSGAEIQVADTGVGIDARDIPRIFERFYRADNSRSRATGGAGIGLSITKAIVEAHGGTISASSHPGRGSEFTISLSARQIS